MSLFLVIWHQNDILHNILASKWWQITLDCYLIKIIKCINTQFFIMQKIQIQKKSWEEKF